jgi:hypothetical protein
VGFLPSLLRTNEEKIEDHENEYQRHDRHEEGGLRADAFGSGTRRLGQEEKIDKIHENRAGYGGVAVMANEK